MALKFPGKLAIANERGHYSGSRIVKFSEGENGKTLDDNINSFFEDMGPHLIVDLRYSGDGKSALVTYTHLMNEDEKKEFDEFSRTMEGHMAKWREKFEEEKAKAKSTEEKEAAETKRLAALGKKCEENHAHLIKQLRALKKGKSVELPPDVDEVESDVPEESEAATSEPQKADEGPTEGSPPAEVSLPTEPVKEGASGADS